MCVEVGLVVIIEIAREPRLYRGPRRSHEIRHRVFRRDTATDELRLRIRRRTRASYRRLRVAGTAAVRVEPRSQPVVGAPGNGLDLLEATLSVIKKGENPSVVVRSEEHTS